MTVADVMTRKPVAVDATATLTAALDAMRERGISSVLVAPSSVSPQYGIITMRDIVSKVVGRELDPESVRVGEIMTLRLVTARTDWTPAQTAQLMAQAGVRRLPVSDGAAIVGLVSDTDLFTALAPQAEWEHVRQVRKERTVRRAARTGAVKTVRDLMASPVLTIGADATVDEAVRKMIAGGISSLLIMTDGGDPHGIITKRDVITKLVAAGGDPRATTVSDLMSSPVKTISPDVTIEECSARMTAEKIRRFPVVEDRVLLGIISDSDILAAVEARRWWGRPGRQPGSYMVADVMRGPDDAEAQGSTIQTGGGGIPPELSVWEAAARMMNAGVRSLPVVQDGHVIGVVSDTDIQRALEERGGGH